jgi:hypothetical protein
MNRCKGFLNELIEKHGDNNNVKKLLSKMLDYYEIYDVIHKTNHYGIFYAVYIERLKSYEEISEKYFIQIDTLKRYIKAYEYLAERLIEKYKIIVNS